MHNLQSIIKNSTRFFLVFLCASVLFACGEFGLELGGTLDQSRTLGGGVHRVTSSLTISGGAVLTIQPGARIVVSPSAFIRVGSDGTLIAVGTEDEPIVFTAADPSTGWMGIDFFNSNNTDNLLEYVIVEFAGSSKQTSANEPASITLTTNKPDPVQARINDTLIVDGFGNGIELAANAIMPEFKNNTITGNAGRAAYAASSSAHWLDGSSSYSGNDEDEVFVKGSPGISEDVEWDSLDAVYIIDGNFKVQAKFTIEAGAQFAFRSAARLEILGEDAALVAIGNSDNNIVFTGVQETPGYWGGIGFSNAISVDNILEYVVVEYGGNARLPGASNKANISVGWTVEKTPSRAIIQNSIIRHSAECGISLERHSSEISTVEGNTYEGNATDECIK